MKYSYSLCAVVLALASGCSTTVVDTNRAANVAGPHIFSTDSVASVEVGDQISGTGCANEFLMIFKSGDYKFVESQGNSSSNPTDRAKAAASYKALAGDKGLSTDIIVNPIWEITRDKTFFGIIADDVCAKVIGWRGVIKSIKKSDTVTKPSADEVKGGASGGFLGGIFK